MKTNTETVIDASKGVGLEINVEKLSVCCCLVIRMQVKIMTEKRQSENMSQYKYLRMTVTDQNLIQEIEFWSRIFCLLICCQKV
jgi:hypothetical protein